MHVSVVIPTRNRHALLEQTLNLYAAQSYVAKQFEIIVVDDGSDDPTAAIVQRLQAIVPYRLGYIRQPWSGPAAARNRGVREACGDVLLFTGDDILPRRDLLEQHVGTSAAHPDAAILGFVEWSHDLPVTEFMRYVAPNGPQFDYSAINDPMNCGYGNFFTANILVPRKWLADDLFDEDFPYPAVEDLEMGYRLEMKGLRIVLNPNAVGYHHHPITAESFYERMARAGASMSILFDKHPELEAVFLPRRLRHLMAFPAVLEAVTFLWSINKRSYWRFRIIRSYLDGIRLGTIR